MKGILLINLGTPDSPSVSDVRKYLTQFLNDPRVIDINPVGRFLLVNGIIVPFRSKKSAKLYEQIWTKEGSPLLIHSIALKEKLQIEMGSDFQVEMGMRYQSPSIENALLKLKAAGVKEIIALPLYPQYASSSTASSIEEVKRIVKKWTDAPSIRFVNKFFDAPEFIHSWILRASKYDINAYDHIVFSYHGLPERQLLKPGTHDGYAQCRIGSCCDVITKNNQHCYRAGCYETTRQLVKALNIPEGKYTSAFQSRLDDKWLKPYSDKIVEELAKKGAKRILVFSPAFVADCLETIYEIGTEYQEIFHEHGGEKLDWVESLNSEDYWVKAVKNILLK